MTDQPTICRQCFQPIAQTSTTNPHLWYAETGGACCPATGRFDHAPRFTSTDYTSHPENEDAEDYAARLAAIVTPTVLAETLESYDEVTYDAVPLMILLTVAEKIAALGGPVATRDDIDNYDLSYDCPNGTVVVNNDQMDYEDGHVSVGLYASHSEYYNLGEATGEVLEFTDLDAAAAHVWSLILDHS